MLLTTLMLSSRGKTGLSKPAVDNDEFNLNEFLTMAGMKQNISFKINKREESYLECFKLFL